ncbi:TadE/TadG family type IV pilus assembly protein [Rhodobium gokarnense]|uniref:Flp pilus assembly protein TadG n=1 Tax=Rhodobium gokarnense TaxID=364296 RepID=A0ABT3H7Z4_9HYPH|nr:TadE/TadG family type IV pilus assembly protein [Rhodobium gokarnense]MCW2306436.1 Flp pilus assembly protein TadG [Rhodobium gokarnense]
MCCQKPWRTGSALSRFSRSQSGSIAVIFALVLVPILALIGLAVEYTLAWKMKSDMQIAADSAALAATVADVGLDEAAASRIFQQNTGEGSLVSYSRTESGDGVTVTVTASGASPVFFTRVIGADAFDVGVTSTAFAPKKLSSARFFPISANGWYNKVVKLMVRRKGETEDEELAEIRYNYQPAVFEVSNTGWIDLGDYESAYLQMDVDPYSKGLESCRSGGCDLTYRTDDPEWSNRLIIDHVQVPANTKIDIFDLVPCGTTSEHAWEDGGSTVSYANADFFYKVTGQCNQVSTENVRLVN